MGRVHTDNLTPGMKLTADLLGPRGILILPRGAVLTGKSIQTIKIWGISEADVEGISEEDIAKREMSRIDPEILRKAEERTEYLFSSPPATPFGGELRRQVLLESAKRYANGDSFGDFEPHELFRDSAKAVSYDDERVPAIHDLVSDSTRLSSFPDIYFQISQVLASPKSSAHHIADVVSKDTSLAAKLLKLVNSSFYGFPARIDSIPRAVAIIGVNELSTLAIGISVISAFRDVTEDVFSMQSFWKHSIACGVFARIYASLEVGLSEERHFVAGILHDIGRLVMIQAMPRHMIASIRLSVRRRLPIHIAEQQVIGYDHATVGGVLLHEWGFPSMLEQIVLFHHRPEESKNVTESAILTLADITTIGLRMGRSGSFFVPEVAPDAWDAVHFPPSAIAPAIMQAERQISEILALFLGKEGDQ